ncbi:natural cytotoxicity triggering receptor 2 precursor [Papio anubis]|uniref:Natural cytotoxicity triggering receptor 2 n=1 Tax=Papio anubis TaxID=9555 RepID=A8MN22_PAPAN|nr:natural cytotoxicity triggering receptor 2 precursor [Papio anubis]ABW05531.1 natural cytotoxicity triggering receptor 2 (predicted) [Papio anubis]
MAWRALHPLLLLLLLFPGSQARSKAQVLQSVAGQTLTVRCQYPPTGRLYEKKGWCKEASALVCIRLVTSSKPRTVAATSRFAIWDDPAAGFFTVTMTDLREEDSGHYWCRIYRPSDNSVSKSVRFYLVVSPASASTQTSWAPRNLVSSQTQTQTQTSWAPRNLVSSQTQTQSCVPPTGGAREDPESPATITVPSQPQNSTLHPGPAAPCALVPVLCGLLVVKSLVLSALLIWWGNIWWKTLMELRSLDTKKATCHLQQVTDIPWTSVSSLVEREILYHTVVRTKISNNDDEHAL